MYAMEANSNSFQILGNELVFPLNAGIFSGDGGMRELTMDEIEFVSGARWGWGTMGGHEYAVPFMWGAAMGGMSSYAMSGSFTNAGIGAFFGGVGAAGGKFLSK